MTAQDHNKEKMIEYIIKKLRSLTPANVRRVMIVASTLADVQEERKN